MSKIEEALENIANGAEWLVLSILTLKACVV
jgi:hypothetical protein